MIMLVDINVIIEGNYLCILFILFMCVVFFFVSVNILGCFVFNFSNYMWLVRCVIELECFVN